MNCLQTKRDTEHKKDQKPNRTGIPSYMKQDFETRSGLSYDDVRVHYSSPKPAELGALAYTQGTHVYIGPGQERHLSHELVHVAQQKRGEVRPTGRLGYVFVNDDSELERQADRGIVAQRVQAPSGPPSHIIQRMIGMEYQTVGGGANVYINKENQFKPNDSHGDILFTVPFEGGIIITVTADGSDLEYVTSPVNTPEEAYEAGRAAAEVHRRLGMYDGTQFSIEGLSAVKNGTQDYWTCKTGGREYKLQNIGDTTTAHPQATVGIKMNKIADLLTELGKSDDKKSEENPGKKNPDGLKLGLTSSGLEKNRISVKKLNKKNEMQNQRKKKLTNKNEKLNNQRENLANEKKSLSEQQKIKNNQQNELDELKEEWRNTRIQLARQGIKKKAMKKHPKIQELRTKIRKKRKDLRKKNRKITNIQNATKKIREKLNQEQNNLWIQEQHIQEKDVALTITPTQKEQERDVLTEQKQKDSMLRASSNAAQAVSECVGQKNVAAYADVIGLLSLLLDYNQQFLIAVTQGYQPANAKNVMPVMSRTSLYDIYCKLNPEAQEVFKSSVDNVDKAGLGRVPYSPQHDLSGQTILAGEFNQRKGETAPTWKSVSLEEWLKGLGQKDDVIYNQKFDSFGTLSDSHENDPNGLKKFGMQKSTQIDIGNGNSVSGILVELRGLERGVPCDKWGEVARQVALLVNRLNEMEKPNGQS